jgi:hypothetical protein
VRFREVLVSIWLLCAIGVVLLPRLAHANEEGKESTEEAATVSPENDEPIEAVSPEDEDEAVVGEAPPVADAAPQETAALEPDPNPTWPEHDFWLRRSHEPGVVNRLLTEYQGTFPLNETMKFRFGGALSFLEQSGLSLIEAEVIYALPPLLSEFTIGLQQERWIDWLVTENRFVAYFTFTPWRDLVLSLGLAYRSPQFNVRSFGQSLNWPGANAEIGILYSVQWTFLTGVDYRLGTQVGDYENMRLYSNGNIHIGLRGEFDLDPNWTLLSYASVGAKGVSGGIVTFTQTLVSFGLRYVR